MEKCNSERSGYDWHGDCCAGDELCCDVAAESVHTQWQILKRLICLKLPTDCTGAERNIMNCKDSYLHWLYTCDGSAEKL